MDRSRRGASSISRRRRSRGSHPSGEASSASASPGDALGAGALRELARRHGIRPSKALGQNFLIDPNLARAIAADAGLRRTDRVVEVGAGLGSLTRALASGGNEVVAVEFDRRLLPALEEAVTDLPGVSVLHADATRLDWPTLTAEGTWVLAANLPYNVGTSIVLDVLERAPSVRRLVVMVQREVAERLAASPGEEAYGAPSVRVAARARAELVRAVPPDVFWPRPAVASAVVRLDRRSDVAAGEDEALLWRVVDEGFAQRALQEAGVGVDARAETLSLEEFRAIAARLPTQVR